MVTISQCHCYILTAISKASPKVLAQVFLLSDDIEWLHVNPPAKHGRTPHPEESFNSINTSCLSLPSISHSLFWIFFFFLCVCECVITYGHLKTVLMWCDIRLQYSDADHACIDFNYST